MWGCVTIESLQILNRIDIQSEAKATATGKLEKEDSSHIRCCKFVAPPIACFYG